MKCMLLLTVMSALGFRAEATDCTTGTFVGGTESSCDASCVYTAQSDASCTANPGLVRNQQLSVRALWQRQGLTAFR